MAPVVPMDVRLTRSMTVATNGCWLSTLQRDKRGYAVITITVGGKESRAFAHRVAYQTFRGPIPAGLVIDHTCHNSDSTCPGGIVCRHRRCINPDHLMPVTQGENIRNSRYVGAINRLKTHCANGHAYDATNTYLTPRGGRDCRICNRAAVVRYQASNGRKRKAKP